MDCEKLESLIVEAQDDLDNYELGSQEFANGVNSLDKLNKMKMDIEKYSDERFDKERQLSLEEEKAQSEAHLNELKIEAQERDSKRGLLKTVIAVVGSVGLTILAIYADEVRPSMKTGWNTVTKILPRP